MSILDLEVKISEIEMKLNEISLDDQEEIEELQQQLNRYKKRAYQHLTAWDHVTLARHSKRPKARDYIEYIFDSFIELHGDRLYRDDEAIIGGIAKLGNQAVTVIDTPGAYPGPEAEERGQGHAIAECLREMSNLTVPTLSIVIGEGGSGGALALGVSDEIWMLEYAIYSILSPEGCGRGDETNS